MRARAREREREKQELQISVGIHTSYFACVALVPITTSTTTTTITAVLSFTHEVRLMMHTRIRIPESHIQNSRERVSALQSEKILFFFLELDISCRGFVCVSCRVLFENRQLNSSMHFAYADWCTYPSVFMSARCLLRTKHN
ncbi:uncharacterized protein PV06_04659 [Exophiala oligosperma]|uniref:Uncharacterized protein n=1 Tax=Exophiala oligosperma TaxID=215243 RepID=A0A0D2DKT5_9EURO|nr:uncharacterized protein PV06_04659 [Exophiala oligosperma]KIW43568.1 hypothetical protein PV06_04659 [Exophiala oligosperma]